MSRLPFERAWWLLFALALLIPSAGLAQVPEQGTVSGQVTDPERRPLSGAVVQVEGTNLRAVTNDAGYYRLTGVPAGELELRASHIGYDVATVIARVDAGLSSQADISLVRRPILIQGIEVEGDRSGSRAAALNRQFTATGILNVISTEQIERFPDGQVADALRRLPGVATFDDRGEAENVFLRGMAPGMNTVTLDGERMPTTGLRSREVSLSAMPAEMLGSIEVVKAITPDMDADAVGGSVNLVTRRPIGDRTVFELSGAGGLHELGYGHNALAGIHFGQSRGPVSYMLRANFRRNDRVMDDVRHFWGEVDFGSGPEDVLDQLRLSTYEIRRDRYAFNGRIDYNLSDRSFVYARGMYNLLDEYSIRHQYRVTPEDGNHLAVGLAERGRLETIGREMTRDEILMSFTLGGEAGLGAAAVDYSLTWAQSENTQPHQRYLNFRSDRYTIGYDISDRNFARWWVDGGDGAAHLEPGTLVLRRHENRTDFVTDSDINARVNFELPYTLAGHRGSLQFGGRYFTKEKDREAWVRRYGIPAEAQLGLQEMMVPGGTFRPIVGDRYQIGHVVDWSRGASFLAERFDSFIEDVDRTYQVSLDDESIDYVATESVAAGYLMSTLDIGDWRVLGGLRMERTETTYSGNESTFDESGSHTGTRQLSEGHDYVNFFPMIHLRYRLSDRSNLRLAWTNSIARPDFSILAPYERVNVDGQTIDRGNPQLDPTRVQSVDLLAEHYFQDIGLLSFGIFYKSLSDFIYGANMTQVGGPYDGFEVRQRRNGGTGRVLGLEAAWQQRLTFLPGTLSGLGIMANYTYTSSTAELEGIDREVKLPRQIPHVANLGLTFDWAGLQSAVTVNHRSRYLFEVTAEEVPDHRSHLYPSADRYLNAQTQVDLSASYRINPSTSVFLELNNLTNTPQTWYDGHPDYHYRSSYNLRWGLLGFRYAL